MMPEAPSESSLHDGSHKQARLPQPPSPLHPASSSPFFTVLPPEIRRMVYIQAFGNGVFHLDLHERTPTPWSREKCETTANTVLDKWRWKGYFCPRVRLRLSYDTEPKVAENNIWRDWCKDERGYKYAEFSEESVWEEWCKDKEEHRKTGIMGWWLCCRQAYYEAKHILFQANDLRLVDQFSKPRLLPNISTFSPISLAWVTSLEIRSIVDLDFSGIAKIYRRIPSLHTHVSFIAPNFPRLIKLRLALDLLQMALESCKLLFSVPERSGYALWDAASAM